MMPTLRVLHIETTTACNLRCVHCTRSLPEYEVRSMPWETFERLISAMRDYRPLVFLNGHGEPLVHPDFRRQFTAAVGSDCRIRFQTNAQLLVPELTAWMLNSGAWERLDVSIDGATANTYEAIRKGASFATLVDNLAAFRTLRRDRPDPSLNIEFVAMRRNIAELPHLIRLAAFVGAASVLVTELQETEHCRGWSLAGDRETFSQPVLDAIEIARNAKIRLELSRSEAVLVGEPTTWKPCDGGGEVCRTPWQVAYVLPDGRVQPCCRLPLSMGNVADGGLEAVLRGDLWRRLLEDIEAGRPPEECRRCPWV